MDSVSVEDFLSDTVKDIQSPSESEFISKISSIRHTVYSLDEGLDADRALIAKSRKFVKGVVAAGLAYVDALLALCDHLENLGQFAQSDNNNGSDLTAGFWKFSVIHRDLGNMFKHLMQNLNSILVFPLETFLQGDLKSDLKKPFDRSLKEYEYKYDKLKKEKLQTMKETGLYTPETFMLEMAENLEKERRRLQLEVCEYFIKVNEVKSKKGSDFLQHLVDFYYTHLHYLKECVGVMEHFGKTLPDLANSIHGLQKEHDTQKRQLVDTREAVRKLIEKEVTQPLNSSYSGTQALPLNLAYGRRKSGFLLKKSDSKVIKRLWQRRRVCVGENGEFCLYHADETKPPVRLSLLTCQLKLPATPAAYTDQSGTTGASAINSVEVTPSAGDTLDCASSTTSATATANVNKRSFFLVSNNRTYQFQAEDDKDFEEWTNVLSNAMQAAFNEAMHHPDWKAGSEDNQSSLHDPSIPTLLHRYHRHHGLCSQSRGDSLTGSDADLLESRLVREFDSHSSRSSTVASDDATSASDTFTGLSGARLHQSIQRVMRKNVPGNRVCADCNRPDPEWVSINLGVLICLECCGTHRELGVQCSRTQSLLMDDLSSVQLLLPRFIGNRLFNEVYESALIEDAKPTPDSDSASRRAYIRWKYLERKFITPTNVVGRRHGHHVGLNDGERSCEDERVLVCQLLRAIRTGDLRALLQAHAEGVDLTTSLDDDMGVAEVPVAAGDTPLHVTIATASTCNASSTNNLLAFMEFILQNAPSSAALLQRTNAAGETALHYAAKFAFPDAIRLLLGVGGCVGIGGVGVDGDALPIAMLTSTDRLKQTPLDIVLSRLSNQFSFAETDTEVETLRQCESLLRLAMDVFNTTSSSVGEDCAPPAFLVCNSSTTITPAEAAARKRLLDALDDLESVQWAALEAPSQHPPSPTTCSGNADTAQRADDAGVDVFSRAFRDTLVGALQFSDSSLPEAHGDRWHVDGSSCQLRSSKCVDSSAAALATLPRKKGPAPQPPLAEHRSWIRTSPASGMLFSRTLATPLRVTPSTTVKHLPADHIEVLLDVLEEHPGVELETPLSNEIPDNGAIATNSSGSSDANEAPATQLVQRAIALYDCDAENPDELTFRRSEIIVVLKAVEVNWWLGHIEGQPSRRGLFPLTHVKLLPLG